MGTMDAFFQQLPAPKVQESFIQSNGYYDDMTLSKAVESLKGQGGTSSDKDRAFLLSRIPEAFTLMPQVNHSGVAGMSQVRQAIAHLAMSKAAAELQGSSATCRQLRYFRWIAQGRNEATKKSTLEEDFGSLVTDDEALESPALTEEVRCCAQCIKTPDSSVNLSYCTGCVIQSNSRNVSCVYYCNEFCQRAHWPSHKTVCNNQKKLIRGAKLLQKLFYVLEAHGSNWKVECISIKNGITSIQEISHEIISFRGEPVIHALRKKDAPSKQAYHHALTFSTCDEVTQVGRQLLKILIEPFCKEIYSRTVLPQNGFHPACNLSQHAATGPETYAMLGHHTVLELVPYAGKSMVLDTAGAQYGWYEAIAPFKQWAGHRALSIKQAEPLPPPYVSSWLIAATNDPIFKKVEKIRFSLAEKLLSIMKDEIAQPGVSSLSALLKAPNTQYQAWEDHVVARAQEECSIILSKEQEPAQGRGYFDQDFSWYLTRSLEEVKALRNVWFTQHEIDEHHGDIVKLRKIWAQRCKDPKKQALFKKLGMKMNFR